MIKKPFSSLGAAFKRGIYSHGSFGLWGAYLAGGETVVPDGYYVPNRISNLSHPINDEQASHFVLKSASVLNWKVMWDPCYERSQSGVLTEDCEQNKAKYGIEGVTDGNNETSSSLQ